MGVSTKIKINKKIYIFLESLDGTFDDEKPSFLELSPEERYYHYRYLIMDIRRIHTQLHKVHLDIKPDNIMVKKKKDLIFNQINKRFKFIDYGLMDNINAPIKTFYKSYAHPDIFNKGQTCQPYLDIYSLLLTIASIEFGNNTIMVHNNCYTTGNYTQFCFDQLRKQIVTESCQKDGYSKSYCFENYQNIINGYRINRCEDLGCFLFVNLRYDGQKMAANLMETGNEENLLVKELTYIIDLYSDKKKRIII